LRNKRAEETGKSNCTDKKGVGKLPPGQIPEESLYIEWMFLGDGQQERMKYLQCFERGAAESRDQLLLIEWWEGIFSDYRGEEKFPQRSAWAIARLVTTFCGREMQRGLLFVTGTDRSPGDSYWTRHIKTTDRMGVKVHVRAKKQAMGATKTGREGSREVYGKEVAPRAFRDRESDGQTFRSCRSHRV